jgi:hypothetical protein
MRRNSRSLAAWVALVALLFAQLAVAAYACPRLAAPEAVASMPMPDCDEPMNANLCESHCDYGSASLDSTKAKVAPPALTAFSTRIVVAVSITATPRPVPPARVATGPPVSRFTVLRI